MKTILHCIDTTGPGGAETVFIDLATGLQASGYRSVVLIRGKGWVYEELGRRGVKPYIIDAKGSFNWRFLRDLVRLIRSEKIDLIQSHLMGSNVYCSLAGLIARIPVVATFHGTVDINNVEPLKRVKFGSINLGAQSIVTVSENLREDILARTSLNGEKMVVIYNGIRTKDFERHHSTSLRERYGWTQDDIVVGCLGNIRSAKGYDILLRAAAQLQGKPFRFAIAGQGKGELLERLLDLRASLKLEKMVQIIGFTDDPSDFLSGLDLFLLPSTSEGFSIATIQAMAAELPVIVTRSGGPQEIVTHGVNGWMIDPGRADAIVDALQYVSADDELRANLASRGHEHAVATFGLDAMLGSYESVYHSLIKCK